MEPDDLLCSRNARPKRGMRRERPGAILARKTRMMKRIGRTPTLVLYSRNVRPEKGLVRRPHVNQHGCPSKERDRKRARRDHLEEFLQARQVLTQATTPSRDRRSIAGGTARRQIDIKKYSRPTLVQLPHTSQHALVVAFLPRIEFIDHSFQRRCRIPLRVRNESCPTRVLHRQHCPLIQQRLHDSEVASLCGGD